MTAAKLFSILVDLGIKLWITINNNIAWEAAEGVNTDKLKKLLVAHKNDLLSIIRTAQEVFVRQKRNHIIHEDCLHALRKMPSESVDLVCTDPPYGMKFMNKGWDRKVPPVEIWQEAYRVLKPGAFALVMCSPRSDCQYSMISVLIKAGFVTRFTPIFWTYRTGAFRNYDIRNALMKRVKTGDKAEMAQRFNGAYGGFRPKPAVEVILVAMKPRTEKTIYEQALANGKGVTWMDDCRIPYADGESIPTRDFTKQKSTSSAGVPASKGDMFVGDKRGRVPANLLVSDDILNVNDDHSKFFSLDRWSLLNLGELPENVQETLPFLIVPKASTVEKDKGLEGFEPSAVNDGREATVDNIYQRGDKKRLNTHPTVKPIKLFNYLITMGSRPGDLIVDPFVGSGSSCISAKMLGRRFIGIEKEEEFCRIAEARLAAVPACKKVSDGRGNRAPSKIISVSRRTDIPAFYGDWFMKRLDAGSVDYTNPVVGQIHSVSLKPEDVECFVFWSKNYAPFIDKLRVIENKGYNFYFNFTITGLPSIFECNLVKTEIAIESLKTISKMYSPRHINWRYDPIVVSDKTDFNYHERRFRELSAAMEGAVERCYFSFITSYRKVSKNIARFREETGVEIIEPANNLQIDLANRLTEIAHQYGISMHTCCGDFLANDNIKKAHCIDAEIITELFGAPSSKMAPGSTRKECGCVKSIDIGAYDTCPHGCVYCYANLDKEKGQAAYKSHNPELHMLGKISRDVELALTDVKESGLVKQNTDGSKKSSATNNHRKNFGTRQWTEKSVNFCTGCAHNCLYCYARHDAHRFKRVPYQDWDQWYIRQHDVDKSYRNFGKRIMFPSSHDLFPDILETGLIVLEKLLKAGNEVLIVSKPHLDVVKSLCDKFGDYKKQILFRFTITATDNRILSFWEPGAPVFEERLDALAYAFDAGFETSVSAEPMLDVDNIDQLITAVAPRVSHSIWLGKMNYLGRIPGEGPEFKQEVERIKASQTNERIRAIYERHCDNQAIRWKNSIKKIVGIEGPDKPGMDI